MVKRFSKMLCYIPASLPRTIVNIVLYQYIGIDRHPDRTEIDFIHLLVNVFSVTCFCTSFS